MSERDDDILKALSMRIARDLTEASGQGSLDTLFRFDLLAGGSADDLPPSAGRQGWVGIWKRQSDGSHARAPEHSAEWNLWADISVIPEKSDKRRVVLVGESVARGYFYDPLLTPSKVLAEMLEAADVPGQAEVVDLARSDIGGLALIQLMMEALALQPDLLVMFAGNNWSQAPTLMNNGLERALGGTVLREQGVPGLKAHLERKLSELIRGQIRQALGALASRVPLVIVIPEFNLADWHLEGEVDPPILSTGANRLWLEAYEAARQALAENRLDDAEANAMRMIEVDGGTAASGFTLLADCKRRRGLNDQARELLENARDSHSWETAAQQPKTLLLIQQALRQAATLPNISVVDLPRMFQEWSGGELPDRRIFLDYCHHTAEGIRLAMAATAQVVAPRLGGRNLPSAYFVAATREPDPVLAGEAHFAAAIHNAHWGQGFDIVYHHCREAAKASPRVARLMQLYLSIKARRAPFWMCEELEPLVRESVSLGRYVLAYTPPRKTFDRILLQAGAEALEHAGFPVRAALDELLRREHGVTPEQSSDLCSSDYRESWADRDWRWAATAYHIAHSPKTRFSLVCQSSHCITLELTCRRRGAQPGDPVCQLRFNSLPLREIAATPDWCTWRVTVPASLVSPGINSVEIVWPADPEAPVESLQREARHLELGLGYDLLPTYGQIHSFKASVYGG
jgi:hypothetical protein